ncbi:hypothetical protein DBV14_17675 [Variovorax sp. KBW07]|uniref:type II TA system antitoxin MqsA family protein n=1 Tax=Variovorax sp. KBW07 TaxID=2153358 RepID=UPI000F56B9C4|nr:type II TA system antitoxin MqsA family protein [Variovorax sp. KBW07]RQO50950.1 hypothetical protein DBV14_17675 [Variovorax sp. KBW07]
MKNTTNAISNRLFHCPSCESTKVNTRLVKDDFQYGEGTEATLISVTLPLRICENCELSYFDEEAEEIRHSAVCKHLKILTPSEITAIRQRYGLSKVEFSNITRVGRISLGRWEAGALLQNAANDSLLFLMGFPENLDRLKERAIDHMKSDAQRKPTRKFRSLSNEQVSIAVRQSSNFSLYANCH